MKKLFLILILVTILCIALIGCDKSEGQAVIGSWYSDKPDTLTLNKDGSYSSNWLGNGKYTVKDGQLNITNPMDGSTKVFEIKNENNKKTFYYLSLDYTYYDNQEEANKRIAEKAAAELKDKEATAAIVAARAKNEAEGTNNIVGMWKSVSGKIVEFTGDGAFIFTKDKRIVWRYEIVDSQNLKIIKDTGETYNQSIKLTKTKNGYELSIPPETFTKK